LAPLPGGITAPVPMPAPLRLPLLFSLLAIKAVVFGSLAIPE
jgi:hypothetical protein